MLKLTFTFLASLLLVPMAALYAAADKPNIDSSVKTPISQ